MNANDQRVTDASTLRKLLNEIITVLEPVDSSALYDDNIPRAIAARLERGQKVENGITILVARMLGVPTHHPSVTEYRRDKLFHEQIQDLQTHIRKYRDCEALVKELSANLQERHEQSLQYLETITKLDARIADLELQTSTPGMLHGVIDRLVGVTGVLQIVSQFIAHQSHNPHRLAAGLKAMAPMITRRLTDWDDVREGLRVYASIVADKIALTQQVTSALAHPNMRSLINAADLLSNTHDEASTPDAVENWMRELADKKREVLALRELNEATLRFCYNTAPAEDVPFHYESDFFAPRWNEETATRIEVNYVLNWPPFLRWLEGIGEQRVFMTIFGRTLYFHTEQERAYWVMGMRQMMEHAGGMMPPHWDSTTHWDSSMPNDDDVLPHCGDEPGRMGAWDLVVGNEPVREIWLGVIGGSVLMASPGGSAPYTRIEKEWHDDWRIRPRGMGGREHSLPMQMGS